MRPKLAELLQYETRHNLHITAETYGLRVDDVLVRANLSRRLRGGDPWQETGIQREVLTPREDGEWGTGKVSFTVAGATRKDGSARAFRTLEAALKERERIVSASPPGAEEPTKEEP